jgi:hypothetical protein
MRGCHSLALLTASYSSPFPQRERELLGAEQGKRLKLTHMRAGVGRVTGGWTAAGDRGMLPLKMTTAYMRLVE